MREEKMKSKKLLAVALALSTTMMGCQAESNKEETVDQQESSSFVIEGGVAQEGETKRFDVGKHMFFIRYAPVDSYKDVGGSIEIPEGYEVFDVENVAEFKGMTVAYDVWYQNTVSVEVTAVYNESIQGYDYSQFGTPIELEKQKVYQKS